MKSRFLAAASHDLRQPLQTIWSLQSALGRALKGSEFVPHLSLLEESVRSMDEILSALIDINRLEKGAIQPVMRDFPLREILARLRSELGYAAASKSLVLDVEDSPEVVSSDPMLLPVILRNLIGNAIKYTVHGTVRLRVRPTGVANRLYRRHRHAASVSRPRICNASSRPSIRSTIRIAISAGASGWVSRSFKPFAGCSITQSRSNRASARALPSPCSRAWCERPMLATNRIADNPPRSHRQRAAPKCCISKMIQVSPDPWRCS